MYKFFQKKINLFLLVSFVFATLHVFGGLRVKAASLPEQTIDAGLTLSIARQMFFEMSLSSHPLFEKIRQDRVVFIPVLDGKKLAKKEIKDITLPLPFPQNIFTYNYLELNLPECFTLDKFFSINFNLHSRAPSSVR